MKTIRWGWAASLMLTWAALAGAEPVAGGGCTELKRWPAAEARQGVAVDGECFYAISNHELGRYRKDTGERLAGWSCPEGEPLIHLNAGIVHVGRLYCAHSNYPAVPQQSSVEIWEAATLRHVGSHSFGRSDGSLTWVERRGDRWLACFVHYGKKGGEPGRGPEWSHLVEYDDTWRETGGWTFPAALIARIGERGYSVSGGALGPDGHLYVTGHDAPELYVLSFPEAGAALIWEATIPIPTQGQAFGWDPTEAGRVYLIARQAKEVIVAQVTPP